jgi:Flp pilus assembly protein TadG
MLAAMSVDDIRRADRGGKRDGERGAIAVLMTIFMTTIMGFAALGFDLAYGRLAREEMQNAVDAAAHAAGITLSISGDTNAATDAAQKIALANSVMGNHVVLADADIVFGSFNFATKTFVPGGTPTRGVQITGSTLDTPTGALQTTFGHVRGVLQLNVTHSVTATYTPRYFQVELQVSDDYICDIDNAADAAVSLLNYLYDGGGGTPADWIGLDVFTGSTKELSMMWNIRQNYTANILPRWKRDASTLSPTQANGGGPSAQTKGIAVCSKANAPSFPFPGLVAVPGGYRQCPSVAKAGGVLPKSEQFQFPNHGWIQFCSDGGPAGFYAGTDLAKAIHDGAAKLTAASPPATASPEETRTLILIADGTPMVCTGIGGGSLCGHTYGGDKVTPPPGKVSSDYWDPCCANALTCGGTTSTYKGVTYGGGAWGDGSPNNSPNGQAACDAARQLLRNAIDEADTAYSNKVDIFVVGFYGDDPTTVSAKFGTGLARGGYGITTGDSTKLAKMLRDIPGRVPITLVK